MDEGSRRLPAAPVAVTGEGSAGADADARPFLRSRKSRKYMGLQDEMAVVAAGRAIGSAGLAAPLGERCGLYLAIGHIPFEKEDAEALLDGTLVDGRVSPSAFSTTGFAAVNPLLTFRCLPNMPAYHVAANFDVQGPYLTTYPGEAQRALAIETAVRALADGEVDVALVGAVRHQRNFLVEHHHARLVPPVAAEDLTDHAAVRVVERAEDAAARGATILATLAELEIGYEPPDPFAPGAGDGFRVDLRWDRP